MKEPESGKYTITKMTPEITRLYDGINDSIYVDEGETEAFVIDTGMAEGSLIDFIREHVTDKPLTLVVTHGHLDHSMKAGEFDRFYMSELDDKLIPPEAKVDLARRISIREGDFIRIPGMELLVAGAAGHTPGSVLFINRQHKVIYHGDAISNGRNCWLQLPGCAKLSEYRANLLHLLDFFAAEGIDTGYTFLGGHYEQRWLYRPVELEENPTDFQMIYDTITLCGKLLSGEIKPELETEDRSMGDQAYTAHYGKVELLFTLKQLC